MFEKASAARERQESTDNALRRLRSPVPSVDGTRLPRSMFGPRRNQRVSVHRVVIEVSDQLGRDLSSFSAELLARPSHENAYKSVQNAYKSIQNAYNSMQMHTKHSRTELMPLYHNPATVTIDGAPRYKLFPSFYCNTGTK